MRIERSSASGLTVEAGKATAGSVTLSGAKFDTSRLSLDRFTGVFAVDARKVSAGTVTTQPHAFTACTITSKGVEIELARGEGGCTRGAAR